MQAVILAGGKGKRLEPLTLDIPKAMISIDGKPMIEIIVEQLKEVGVKEITIIVNYLKEKIMDYLKDGSRYDLKINYAVQKEALGDADALAYAQPFITDDKFILIACDSLFPTSHLKNILRDDCDGVMTVFEVEDARRFGVILHDGQNVKQIIEKSPNPPSNLANTYIYHMPKDIFDEINLIKADKTGELRTVYAVQNLINKNKIFKFMKVSDWLDIGTHEQLEEAQELARKLGLCRQ